MLLTTLNLTGDEIRAGEIKKLGSDPENGVVYLYNNTGIKLPLGIEMIPEVAVRISVRSDGEYKETVVSLLRDRDDYPIPERDIGIILGRAIKTGRLPIFSSVELTIISDYTEVLVPGPQVFFYYNSHFIEKPLAEPTDFDEVRFL